MPFSHRRDRLARALCRDSCKQFNVQRPSGIFIGCLWRPLHLKKGRSNFQAFIPHFSSKFESFIRTTFHRNGYLQTMDRNCQVLSFPSIESFMDSRLYKVRIVVPIVDRREFTFYIIVKPRRNCIRKIVIRLSVWSRICR